MRLEGIPINGHDPRSEGGKPGPEYMIMPVEMATWDQPDGEAWAGAAQSHPEAVARLHRIQAEADFYTHGEPNAMGGLDALDADSGDRQWRFGERLTGFWAPAVLDGAVCVASGRGLVALR